MCRVSGLPSGPDKIPLLFHGDAVYHLSSARRRPKRNQSTTGKITVGGQLSEPPIGVEMNLSLYLDVWRWDTGRLDRFELSYHSCLGHAQSCARQTSKLPYSDNEDSMLFLRASLKGPTILSRLDHPLAKCVASEALGWGPQSEHGHDDDDDGCHPISTTIEEVRHYCFSGGDERMP